MHTDIVKQFDDYGIELPEDIIDKCVELCMTNNIDDPVQFVEQWMAYTLTNLKGADPTIQFLIEFERKELIGKKKDTLNASIVKNGTLVNDYDNNSLTLYGINNSNSTGNHGINDNGINDDEDNIMDSYICKTPKAKNIKNISRTPANKNENLFTPISYSPISGTPRANTEGSGKVVYTFGNQKLIANALWSSKAKQLINVKQLLTYQNETITNKSKYLYDNVMEKCSIYADEIFWQGKQICEKTLGNMITNYDFQHPDVPNQEVIKSIGTIRCEHDGKLDINSTILIESDEMRLRTIRLNFDRCKSFGVFPGQTVLITGTNTRGDIFNVEQIISERTLKIPILPKLNNQISFVISSGPYTNYDDLLYEPLQDLLTYCMDNKPDVLILIGPFIEADHSMITGNILAETFESFFEKMISGIVEKIGIETTICLISSNKDVNADSVYPTPPVITKNIYSNVYMLPDPCIIDLNGIKIGITSTDIFNHLLSNELFKNAGDKIKRITNYLFNQGSFYPMKPATDGICLDSQLANKFAKIDEIPNVMILPSDQNCFIRDVNSCLTINPGRLTDNNGGTFARLIIHPLPDDINNNLCNYAACQVMKV